ncbi:MAG: diguanylate cyclase [Thermoleophilia bacterium]|nr:diguanylate cyclase [Thermoleophilia bacterium]
MRLSVRTIVAALLLLGLSGVAFVVANRAADADTRRERDRQAEVTATAVATAIAEVSAGPRTAVGLFATAGSPERFAEAADTGTRNPAVVALAWAPRVPDGLRSAFESARGFTLTEPGADGTLKPAGSRADHLPVTYLAPENGRTTDLRGLDMAAVPGVTQAVEAAADAGEGRVSAPSVIAGHGLVSAFVEPSFPAGTADDPTARRGALSGVVVSLVQPTALVSDALGTPAGTAIRVTDGDVQLYRTGGDLTGAVVRDVRVGGRTWRLQVAAPAPSGAAWLPWVILAAGIAVTVLVTAILEGIARRRAWAEELVAERTRALRVALKQSRELNIKLDQARELAEERSRIDALTGLFNRSHMVDQLTGELRRADAGAQPGLVLIDIQGLRDANHTYGHTAGDDLLQEVAKRLRGTLRNYDCVARWDAKRFALLVPQVPDDGALWRVAESLRQVITSAPIPIGDGHEIWTRCAVGCAHGSTDLTDADLLLDAAELAVSRARSSGADRAVLHGEIAADLAQQPDALRIAEALARTASLREGMPEEHCPQVAELAVAVADRLELSAQESMRCRLAGWLHDVGKVAIPEAILTKPGPLDDNEWEIMRTHSELGERMLAGMPNLTDVAPVVRHHHERWDGTGYPDGLAGAAIPVEARIVAAADAYSAITSSPPFHAPRDPAQAVAELRRSAGTHLEPRVAEALCQVIEERLAAGTAVHMAP